MYKKLITLGLSLILFGCSTSKISTDVTLAPPIPNLAKWESQMIQYATPLCNQAAINKALGGRTVDEGNVWYYDGTRVFSQIAAYTGNAEWYRCAGYVASAYKGYVTGFRTPGWRVFPKGLADDFVRTQDTTEAKAVSDLATISAFANDPSDPAWSDSWEYSREIAYIMDAYIYNLKINGVTSSQMPLALEDIFGHFDQWLSTATTVKPFMEGLSAEALIEYYENVSPDPRILPTLQAAADYLWANAWRPASRSFEYAICRGKKTRECAQGPSPDLNLLVAPLYAWLYKQTGDSKYQIEGDEIFSGGVDLAWLGGGKQFSQNYRWSPKYVEWRK